MTDLDELKQLEAAATPRPWRMDWDWFSREADFKKYSAYSMTPTVYADTMQEISTLAYNDRIFVETLRNAAPELFTRLAELEAEVERLKKFITAAACKLDSNDATGGLYVLRCALAGGPFRDENQYYPPDDAPPSLDEYVTDGFGIYWPAKCPDCGAPMQVIRPGDCRCSAECYTIDDRLSDEESEK